MIKETIFSPCREYRYTLYREWEEGQGVCMFIGLNPSTADEIKNDPTVIRCINYAKRWGYQAMYMANIFAYRATDPNVMKEHPEPVGNNDIYLKGMAKDSSIIALLHGGIMVHSRQETMRLKDFYLTCIV
ncbi:DUF1643 domain-containing protein [Nitrosomonas sp. Nm34]|uniref:DUF1643 domain-containing protein n=1 Tax=Nitrosomonas sp. Nm34 TaxID=1881055 RepID=UPI0008E341CA|nr:DUF1643 domain-containing protein [Nitrosomonas sp. Nm34]SFI76527.1 hypothetical protein SAMN05428978_103334 [Nitrosomonas sp. Nm34]